MNNGIESMHAIWKVQSLKSVFTWCDGGYIGFFPKQSNGGHVGVPRKYSGSCTLFLCIRFLSFRLISIDAGRVSENAMWVTTLIWRKHCSIDQSCYSMTSKRFLESSSGMKFFSAERSLNQPKARCVCIRLINHSNRFNSVRLLFLFRSRVFISRSYEYRSIMFNNRWNQQHWPPTFF